MKKIILLSILLFQLTYVFGQYGTNKDCAESGCGDKSQNITRCWGNPQTFPDFPGIVVRVKGPIEHCFNAINDEPNKHSYGWWIEIKGSTNSLFRIDVTDGFGKTTNFGGNQDGVCVYPFEITQKDIQDANNSRLANKGEVADFKTFSNAETINVSLIKCTSSFKGSSNSNNQTTQQNDLSEYNRSKADLERQMAEKNAEIQRQNQENARLGQIWNNAIKKGVDAHNSGNYTEAKNQFTTAINNSSNEQNRQNAQNYYNKSVEAEKSQGKIKAVTEFATTTINAFGELAKAREEKRQQQENERIKQEQKEYKLQQARDIMESDWINAQNLANLEDYTQAIKLMLPYANENKLNGMAINTIAFWYEKLKEYENAKDWYFKAYKLGDVNATRNIGVLYINGMGVKKNNGVGIQYFQEACNKGLEIACNEYKTYKNELEKNVGESKSYNDLCFIAQTYYAEKNYQKAVDYYTQAYEINTSAKWTIPYNIASIYKEPELYNLELASIWYERALKKMENDPTTNNEKYQNALFNYANSTKMRDGKLAIDAFLLAGIKGKSNAYTNIGVIYELGLGGIKKDWNMAKIYYEKDAEKNSVIAMNNLGQLYEKGGPNLEIDKNLAKKWFKMACKTDKNYCK